MLLIWVHSELEVHIFSSNVRTKIATVSEGCLRFLLPRTEKKGLNRIFSKRQTENIHAVLFAKQLNTNNMYGYCNFLP